MSAVAEGRKHLPVADAHDAPMPPPDPLWAAILDKVHTHQKDRESLYRLLAR